ncbi:hypothetical protein niasHT_009283 [Heterodera trifolii]|uniref:Tetratricopeptide repeat protein 30 n=1 Tax=Heterodera trifolii TaxID=157864 RepID=A0ABD2MBV6_9BILA
MAFVPIKDGEFTSTIYAMRARRWHGLGSAVPFRSVGNTLLLHESAVVEACNLKFAIEYRMKNMEAAAEALSDLPARMEEELDPVTLHNQAQTEKQPWLANKWTKRIGQQFLAN